VLFLCSAETIIQDTQSVTEELPKCPSRDTQDSFEDFYNCYIKVISKLVNTSKEDRIQGSECYIAGGCSIWFTASLRSLQWLWGSRMHCFVPLNLFLYYMRLYFGPLH